MCNKKKRTSHASSAHDAAFRKTLWIRVSPSARKVLPVQHGKHSIITTLIIIIIVHMPSGVIPRTTHKAIVLDDFIEYAWHNYIRVGWPVACSHEVRLPVGCDVIFGYRPTIRRLSLLCW